MLKKMLPALALFLCLMLDTAVLPVWLTGVYVVPTALACVLCIAMSLGRIHGMLYGLIAGLLIDVLTGYPLGLNMFLYIGCGYLSGALGFLTEEDRRRFGVTRWGRRLRRVLIALSAYASFELVFLIYQYFNTARFERVYLTNAILRALFGAALTLILFPLGIRMFAARPDARKRDKKEVKTL